MRGLVETPAFRNGAIRCMTESALKEMLDALARDPLAGDLIAATGGVRKLRWGTGRDDGKRGGVRVLYYARQHTDRPIYLLTCMPKREDKHLTAAQKKALARAISEIDRANVVRLDAIRRGR